MTLFRTLSRRVRAPKHKLLGVKKIVSTITILMLMDSRAATDDFFVFLIELVVSIYNVSFSAATVTRC